MNRELKKSFSQVKNGCFLKRILAIFLIFMLIFVESFCIHSHASLQGEENFCVDWVENLPVSHEFLNEVKQLPKIDDLDEFRKFFVKHKNKPNETKYINEKRCYIAIQKKVEQLKAKVKARTAPAGTSKADMEKYKQYSKYSDISEKARLAKAIYRWVAKNISFDSGGFSVYDDQSSLNPQDAFFVFATRKAVCEGYSRLTQLMMNMADIPCVYLGSIMGRYENCGHAFNAVYLDDGGEGRKGWTLIDTTWGHSTGHGHVLDPLKNANELIFEANDGRDSNKIHKNKLYKDKTNINNGVRKFTNNSRDGYFRYVGENNTKRHLSSSKPLKLDVIQRYFPAFYYKDISFKDANRMMIKQSFHKIAGIDGISLDWSKKVNFPALDCSTHEGSGKIEISAWSALSEDEKNNYRVPAELIKYNLPIQIPCDVKRLILSGDEIIDISGAVNLQDINTTNSKKYDFENGVLYKKVDGKRGKEIAKISSK